MISFRPIAIAIAFSLAGAPLYAQQRTVTLTEALGMAEQYNPGLVNAKKQLSLTKYKLGRPLIWWLPKIGLNLSTTIDYNHFDRFDPITSERISGGVTQRSYLLGLAGSYSQELGVNTKKDFTERRIQVDQSEIQYTQAALQLAAQVI